MSVRDGADADRYGKNDTSCRSSEKRKVKREKYMGVDCGTSA